LPKDQKIISTLRRAQLAVGGISDLAARLNVPIFELTRWIEGEATPPPEVCAAAAKLASEDKSNF
jgi:hypothetical protein